MNTIIKQVIIIFSMRVEVYSDICSIQIVNSCKHCDAMHDFLGFEIYDNNMAEHMMLTFLKKIKMLDLPVK